ncbi:hypothetical protein BS333_06970 [Vibrio azureus]|uniref:Uncharacterized protein n=1 Tax=Vibrio azureus NBRC 104587 TaxID=1219077 RepID=U3CEE9_9VIBR|nr:hypothetical protein [Vibrio azureus]AUI86148.1 hypothetical protein BS333_06970 [Vibrio azureus]GAD76693.1 hypothetical protein VAZ01S_050_00050 [Vibrio azureus NBRC 104587]
MKKITAALIIMATNQASVQAQENTPEVISSTSPEGVHTKYESEHQVQEAMAEKGFTLHRCGIHTMVQKYGSAGDEVTIPHSQIQCFYSKPGELPSDNSELAYWNLQISYDTSDQLYKADKEFVHYYEGKVRTIRPEYLLDSAPHLYKQRAALQSAGMTVGNCDLQQVYYFMKPTEDVYLSNLATCPVHTPDRDLSGYIKLDINFDNQTKSYTEAAVSYIAL